MKTSEELEAEVRMLVKKLLSKYATETKSLELGAFGAKSLLYSLAVFRSSEDIPKR